MYSPQANLYARKSLATTTNEHSLQAHNSERTPINNSIFKEHSFILRSFWDKKVSLCASSKFVVSDFNGELQKFNYYTTTKFTYSDFKNFGTTKLISVLVQSSQFRTSKFLELQSLLLWQYKVYSFRLQSFCSCKFYYCGNTKNLVLDLKVLEPQVYLCARTKFILSYFQNFGTTIFFSMQVQRSYLHILKIFRANKVY